MNFVAEFTQLLSISPIGVILAILVGLGVLQKLDVVCLILLGCSGYGGGLTLVVGRLGEWMRMRRNLAHPETGR